MRDPTCADGICAIVTDIANGDVPGPIRRMLLASRLIGLAKVSGGLRPIAIGDSFYRLAALYVLKQCETESIFQHSVQYGVGTKGGAERAVHVIRAELDHAPPNTDPILITIDIENAFNSRPRSDIARSVFDQTLRDRVGHMWRMFHWAYSSTSALLYYGIDGRLISTLQSAEGVRQGDPLAALSFALSVHSLFVNALRDTGAKGVAVLDDLSII